MPEVLHISCNMCTCDLPDMYVLSSQPVALGHTYQANPSCTCYNLYMYFIIFLGPVFVDGVEAEEVEAEEVFEYDVGNKIEVGGEDEVEIGYCETEDVNLTKQSKQVSMSSHDLVTKF